MTPTIDGPDRHDFHDSSLIDFMVNPHLDKVKIVLSTPDEDSIQRLWLVEFGGVLRLEYETLGSGAGENHDIPLEIYDIYNDEASEERRRWVKRLKLLGLGARASDSVFHIVLASSFMRGWGKNQKSEGINIICRTVDIRPATEDYQGMEYRRPVIEAGEE